MQTKKIIIDLRISKNIKNDDGEKHEKASKPVDWVQTDSWTNDQNWEQHQPTDWLGFHRPVSMNLSENGHHINNILIFKYYH